MRTMRATFLRIFREGRACKCPCRWCGLRVKDCKAEGKCLKGRGKRGKEWHDWGCKNRAGGTGFRGAKVHLSVAERKGRKRGRTLCDLLVPTRPKHKYCVPARVRGFSMLEFVSCQNCYSKALKNGYRPYTRKDLRIPR